MNFAGNFIEIGRVDTSDLRSAALDLSDAEWNEDIFRQKRYEVHRDTRTVGLVFDPDFRHSHPTRMPMLQRFAPALQPVLEMVAEHYEGSERGQELIKEYGLGYFIRATLVKLRAGGSIDEHTDNNFSLVHSHRVHLPILTNDQVLFTVGSQTINMEEGALYEINNRRKHSVANRGDTDRIHLIMDFVLPGEQCCCGSLWHPHTLCSPQACRPTDQKQIPCFCYPES